MRLIVSCKHILTIYGPLRCRYPKGINSPGLVPELVSSPTSSRSQIGDQADPVN